MNSNKIKILLISTQLLFFASCEKDAKNVKIKTEKMDSSEKYGRILGWLFIDDQTISINEQMISDGHAWGYLGDTKVKDFEALSKARKKSGK